MDELLAQEKAKLMEGEKFTPLDTGVQGVILIKVNDECMDPRELVSSSMKKAKETGELDSRWVHRMIPFQITTYPSIENIKEYGEPLVKQYLSGKAIPPAEEEEKATSPVNGEGIQDTHPSQQLRWGVAFKKRNNSSFPKMDAINAIAEMVGPDHKVDLGTKQDFTIILEVFRSVCGMSIVEDYNELAKYNLRSLAENNKKSGNEDDGGGAGGERVLKEKPAPQQTNESNNKELEGVETVGEK
ncbi:unnamed protein product [Heterosigma akashiwo]